MNEDELIESFAEFYAYVDQEVRPTIPTIISMSDMNQRGEWSEVVDYAPNDCVTLHGVMYVSLFHNCGITPASLTGTWVEISKPLPDDEPWPKFKFESLEPPTWNKEWNEDFSRTVARWTAERMAFEAIKPPASLRIGSVS